MKIATVDIFSMKKSLPTGLYREFSEIGWAYDLTSILPSVCSTDCDAVRSNVS